MQPKLNTEMFKDRETMLSMFIQNFLVVATLVKRADEKGLLAVFPSEDQEFLIENRKLLLMGITAEMVVSLGITSAALHKQQIQEKPDIVPVLAPALGRAIANGKPLNTFDSLLKSIISYQGVLCECLRKIENEEEKYRFATEFSLKDGPEFFVQVNGFVEAMFENFIEKDVSIVKTPVFVVQDILNNYMDRLIERVAVEERKNSTTH